MRVNSLPKGASITGNDFLIIDNGKSTKQVTLSDTTEFLCDEIFGGGGKPLFTAIYLQSKSAG